MKVLLRVEMQNQALVQENKHMLLSMGTQETTNTISRTAKMQNLPAYLVQSRVHTSASIVLMFNVLHCL